MTLDGGLYFGLSHYLFLYNYVDTVPSDTKCGFTSVETTLGLDGLDFLVQCNQTTLYCSQ